MSGPHTGIWLITLGFSTKRQLMAAMEQSKAAACPVEDALVTQGALPLVEVQGALQLKQDLASVLSLRDFPIPEEVLALVPKGYALRERTVRAEAAEAAARVAVAEERARIARELHDVVAHAVSVMVLQVGAVRHRLPDGLDEDVEALRRVEQAGRSALTEMRGLLGAMRREGDPVEREKARQFHREQGLRAVQTQKHRGRALPAGIPGPEPGTVLRHERPVLPEGQEQARLPPGRDPVLAGALGAGPFEGIAGKSEGHGHGPQVAKR